MNFIRDIGREEMYIKYVHQLVNVGGGRDFRFVSPDTYHPFRPICNLKIMWKLHLLSSCTLTSTNGIYTPSFLLWKILDYHSNPSSTAKRLFAS
jgi:hypothetical protein